LWRGRPDAIVATTRCGKLRPIVFTGAFLWGHEYVDKGLQYYEQRHREQQVHLLTKRAAKLGLQIVEPNAA
jgi:hypothetical protein